MSIVLDGTSGLTSPAAVLTTTPLAVTSGGTGVTTKTGTGAVVLGTSPTITGATITVAATDAPAFSAYQSTLQSLSTGVDTKILFQTETFDTNNNFASSRFTPTVAGYYQINSNITAILNINNTPLFAKVYKNGTNYLWGQSMGALTAYPTASVSTVIYMNGSTDYLEIYGFHTYATAVNTLNDSTYTQFSGSMVRSA